jgi:hypothetical protein
MGSSPHNRIFEFTSARFGRGFGGNRLGLAIHPVHPIVAYFENLFAAKGRKRHREKGLQPFPVRNVMGQ